MAIEEDTWHAYTGRESARLVSRFLEDWQTSSSLLLNAGSGIYQFGINRWKEISVDLFTSPLKRQQNAICASVEALPLRSESIGAVICIGEVLAYCDPALAIAEFSRVLVSSGILILDFGSTKSIRHLFERRYGRAADIFVDHYNGSAEKTWIYDPNYIKSILASFKFLILEEAGIHTWSAFARRLGVSMPNAVFLQRVLNWVQLPVNVADLRMIVAARHEIEK